MPFTNDLKFSRRPTLMKTLLVVGRVSRLKTTDVSDNISVATTTALTIETDGTLNVGDF